MVIAHAPENSGCAFATAPTDCDFIPMSMPDPPAVMPDEDFIHLRERYHQLPVDLDVRVAWADSSLLGSQHESVMQIRWAIERGDYDNWPALQAMQLLKNRLKPC